MIKAQFGFDERGNPVIPRQNPQPQRADNQPTVDVNAVLEQNKILMQQMGLMSQKINEMSNQSSEQAPVRPDNFDINDIYNPDTPSGKYYLDEREHRDKQLIQGIANQFDERFKEMETRNTYSKKLNDFAASKKISPNEMAEFQRFVEKPDVGFEDLYDLYTLKTKQTQPVNAQVQEQFRQPGQKTVEVPELANAPSGESNFGEPKTFGQQIAETAKKGGMI